MRQLVQLQNDLQSIQATGTQVVGISYDAVDDLANFASQRKVTFPLLSDKDSHVIDAFEVRNKEAQGRQNGIPHPITFVIDGQGVIRAKLDGTVLKRHNTEDLLNAVKALD